ncbi:MAG: dynamin family protein [Lachnospiraceae bacterium]|nr:dynamin family protein [Lachnospiraceae bacterium]
MDIFKTDDTLFQAFTDSVEDILSEIRDYAKEDDVAVIQKFISNFRMKTEEFFREDRKLNVGVVGQAKAGKSSFLNTLLFEGKEVLPKASTPKTAVLTKMEYSEENVIRVDYYSPEDWEVIEDNAMVDQDDEIYASARELVDMVRHSGLDPLPYLEMGEEEIHFDKYEDLLNSLNDYVGEDGRFTPIVESVTLFLNKEEFRGLSVVDTPGLNDPIASRTIRTREFMELCDVVFFLSQSGSFLDKSDWILLSSQLPQKGVKRLVLIASKYDSGVRDVLRVPDEDDIFGEDENTADTIPKACRLIQRKLEKRTKRKVSEFVKDLEKRGSEPELIEVIRQCEKPILVSAMAYNMTGKPEEEYSAEERNVYRALKNFSADIQSDLRLLGNFDAVRNLFDEVVAEKESILEQKAGSFVPTAAEELRGYLEGFVNKTAQRIQMLEGNDRDQLLAQKNEMSSRMESIRADILSVFGELKARLETEKAESLRELRELGKEYLEIRERTGTVTRTGSYTTGRFIFKKTHTYTYEDHYSYCLASDAAENLKKYAVESSNHAEEVFTEALQITEVKRKLLNIVVNNFDMGSENYDSSLFRIMVEETVASIEFPALDLDISKEMDGITGKFTGELTSGSQKTELGMALSNAISRMFEEISRKLTTEVRSFKDSLDQIAAAVQDRLLENITAELESLIEQCENKEKEIAGYQAYATILKNQLKRL